MDGSKHQVRAIIVYKNFLTYVLARELFGQQNSKLLLNSNYLLL